MKQLIEDYERRLKTAETMLERKNYSSITQAERIKTKASCYRTFIAELKQQCNIPNVVGRSEQLQGFFKFYKQKFGGGFNTDVLETTLKQYQETL